MSCSYGSAFNNITQSYACGIQIQASGNDTPLNSTLAFPSSALQKCCGNEKVQQIASADPSCNIQWCEVPTSDYGVTTTIFFGSAQTFDANGPLQSVQDCISALRLAIPGVISNFCSLRTFDPATVFGTTTTMNSRSSTSTRTSSTAPRTSTSASTPTTMSSTTTASSTTVSSLSSTNDRVRVVALLLLATSLLFAGC